MPIHEVITGRLTRNPERRQTNKGTQYAAVSVAADSGWGDRQQTFFISAQIFGRRADSVLNYEKGDLVEMIGERHSFNGQDGSVVDTVENAEIYLLKRKHPRQQGNYQNNGGYNQNNNYNQNPQLTPDQVPNTGNNNYQQGNQGGYQNNQGGYNQQQNNGQNYQQGQLDTGQGGWENTGAGQKMNQLNNQNNPYPQNGQNGPQNNSGNQQGNYPNQQGNDAQGQQEQPQDGNQGNGNLPF